MALGFTFWASVMSFVSGLNCTAFEGYYSEGNALCSCTFCFAYALLLSSCYTVLPELFVVAYATLSDSASIPCVFAVSVVVP